MRIITIESVDVAQKLKKMDENLGKGSRNLVWTSFPYTEDNLKTVKKSLQKLQWPKNQYRLFFDEENIFVEKDLFEKDKKSF
jgi:hypothetical protein